MSRNYTLGVKDFGPIAEANIELRPMTVLVGRVIRGNRILPPWSTCYIDACGIEVNSLNWPTWPHLTQTC